MLVDISTPRMSRMNLAIIELVPLTAGTEYVQAPVAANSIIGQNTVGWWADLHIFNPRLQVGLTMIQIRLTELYYFRGEIREADASRRRASSHSLLITIIELDDLDSRKSK